MAMEYSEKVMEHFAHPHNVGVIEDANGIGEVGNAKCGDIMKMYLKINDDEIIADVTFQTFGCASVALCCFAASVSAFGCCAITFRCASVSFFLCRIFCGSFFARLFIVAF